MTDPFRDHLQQAITPAYVIERELTGGGMSRVFVATETALKREVVIKVLPPELAAGVNRERFRREIQLAAALQHPHIVPLLSAGESDDLLYYTMPFIRGESLKSAVERRGALPVREVVRILHDVADALAYAHDHGVIHRDIKPANVLMSGQHAVITDFGVAKALSASLGPVGVTTSGVVIGTPAYMAPEQLAADPAADQRIDIYAVGLLAYELLTGKSPFADRSSPQATMAAQLTEKPKPLAECVPAVPGALADLVMRCLEKVPDARPATAHVLAAALDEVATPTAVLTPAAVARGGRQPSRRVVAATTAVMTVAIVAALALTLSHRPVNTPEVLPTATPQDTTRTPPTATPAPTPTPKAAQQGAPMLTHDDSLAIAAAVQKRLDQARRRSATPEAAGAIPNLDSMRVAIQQALGDSIRQALARARGLRVFRVDSMGVPRPNLAPVMPGLPMPPEVRGRSSGWMAELQSDSAAMRRVAVAQIAPGGPPNLSAPAHAMTDTLRARLTANGFDVVNADTGRAARFAGSDPLRLARGQHAAVAITGVALQQGDSISYMLVIADLRRGENVRTISGGKAPLSDPLRAAGRFANMVSEWLRRGSR